MSDPNPKKAFGDAKVPLHLVPPAAMIAIAKALAEGAEKYDPWNWRVDDVETMTYIGAVFRHLAAYVEGEEIDPDSPTGKTHLDGAIGSLAILIDAESVGSLIDNRPERKSCGTLVALKQGARKPEPLPDWAVGRHPWPPPEPKLPLWAEGIGSKTLRKAIIKTDQGDRDMLSDRWKKSIREMDGDKSCKDKDE